MNKRQATRLYNVAKATRETKFPKKFMMEDLVHPCGAPACALGNYASRPDLQRFIKIERTDYGGLGTAFEESSVVYTGPNGYGMSIDDNEVLSYFGISEEEALSLFSSRGCGNAKTPKEASQFIMNFLKTKGFSKKDFE